MRACLRDFGSFEGAAVNAQWVPRPYTRGADERQVSSTEDSERLDALRRGYAPRSWRKYSRAVGCASVSFGESTSNATSGRSSTGIVTGRGSVGGGGGCVASVREPSAGVVTGWRSDAMTRANRKLRYGG
eukprot:2247128-Pleurochrysis_carterae.AAC.4